MQHVSTYPVTPGGAMEPMRFFLLRWFPYELVACGLVLILAIPFLRLPLLRIGRQRYADSKARFDHANEATRLLRRADGGPGPEVEDADLYPVKYVSGKHSHSLLRLVPWDASGTLIASKRCFYFTGNSALGQPLELLFDPENSLVNYQSGSKLWDGGLTWCVIEVEGEKHYFTSEVALPSKEDEFLEPHSTGALYRTLTDRYIKTTH